LTSGLLNAILSPSNLCPEEGDKMQQAERRIGRELAAIEPSDQEVFRAFFLYAGQVKNGRGENIGIFWHSLNEVIKLAAEKAPFLGRLLDKDGELTSEANEEFNRLKYGNVAVGSMNRFSLTDDQVIRDREASSIRTLFTDQGIETLKQATEYAITTWAVN